MTTTRNCRTRTCANVRHTSRPPWQTHTTPCESSVATTARNRRARARANTTPRWAGIVGYRTHSLWEQPSVHITPHHATSHQIMPHHTTSRTPHGSSPPSAMADAPAPSAKNTPNLRPEGRGRATKGDEGMQRKWARKREREHTRVHALSAERERARRQRRGARAPTEGCSYATRTPLLAPTRARRRR